MGWATMLMTMSLLEHPFPLFCGFLKSCGVMVLRGNMSRSGFSSPHENGLKELKVLWGRVLLPWRMDYLPSGFWRTQRVYGKPCIYIYILLLKKTNYIHLLILI